MTSPSPSPMGRDPQTQELINKISIDITIKGEFLPRFIYARNWDAARQYLATDAFAAIADKVQFLTLTNREA